MNSNCCYMCHTDFHSPRILWNHLKEEHELPEGGNFICSNCNNVFNLRNSYRDHILSSVCSRVPIIRRNVAENYHDLHMEIDQNDDGAAENYDPPMDIDNDNNNDINYNNNNNNNNAVIEQPPQPNKVQEAAMDFILSLQRSGKIPFTMVQEIQKSTHLLVSKVCQEVEETTTKLFNSNCQIESNRIRRELQNMRNPFQSIDTQYRREKCLKHVNEYEDAKEFRLGPEPTKDFLYYTSIGNLIKRLCTKAGFLKSVLQKTSNTPGGIICNYKDGSHFKSSASSFDCPVIDILVYYDDIESSNPLGSRAGGNGKLAMFYFQVLNLPSYVSSKLESIFILACTLSENLKKYGINKCLRPIVDELHELWSDGIEVETEFYTGKLKVRLWQLIGDNLGLHSLLGFVESFSANYPCRFCRIRRNVMKTAVLEKPELLRNCENYEEDLNAQDVSSTGIKVDSILNELPYFHITFNFAPDCMHDLMEGICHRVIKIVVKTALQENFFTLNHLNYKIKNCKIGIYEQRNLPSEITQRYLDNESQAGQSASQMSCLIFHLPFWIGNKFPENNKTWKLFIQLHNVMQIIFAPHISHSGLDYLRCLIEDFLSSLLQHSPNGLKPKDHYLSHYSSLIHKIGPLKQYWCMRFEAKHRFPKAVAIHSNNHINTAKTVFHRNQLQLVSIFRSLDFSKDFEFSTVKETEMLIPNYLAQYFPDQEKITKCQQLLFNGINLQAHSLLINSWLDNGPELFQISELCVIEEIPYAWVYKVSCEYDQHLNAYKIGQTSENRSFIPVSKLQVNSIMSRLTIDSAADEIENYVILPFQLI